MTSDPIGLEGGLNTYGYVGGNPLGLVDPNGLKFEDVRRAWQWIDTNYPQLTNDVDIATNPLLDYSPWSGMAYGNSAIIRKSYVTDCLDENQINALRRTLLHELLHLHLNKQLGGLWNYVVSDIRNDGKSHDWVFEKAANIQRYWEGTTLSGEGKPELGGIPK